MTPEAISQAPLLELVSTYNQCLNLSRAYLDSTRQSDEKDFDNNRLEQFVAIRAELFAAAEGNLKMLAAIPSDPEDRNRQELTAKVKSIMTELLRVENELSTFLGEHLDKMRQTIMQMKKSQPVFKRYSSIGGHMPPCRVTRRE